MFSDKVGDKAVPVTQYELVVAKPPSASKLALSNRLEERVPTRVSFSATDKTMAGRLHKLADNTSRAASDVFMVVILIAGILDANYPRWVFRRALMIGY